MKMIGARILCSVILGLAAVPLTASGPLGMYGIIDKVVFEPNQRAPERVQLWGAFAYADGDPRPGSSPSQAKRGYLYFRLLASGAEIETVRTEWKDLASVAGTDQAVGFGSWAYVGMFPKVPDAPPSNWMGLRSGGPSMDLRVRPSSEAPTNPAIYETNVGIVKLAASGSHKDIVAALRKALGRAPAPDSR